MKRKQELLVDSPMSEGSSSGASLDDGFPIEGEQSIDGDGSIAVTEIDASMQIMEDGDYPEDEEFESTTPSFKAGC